MHFISGTVEGNGAREVMWEGYQLERTSIPLWSHDSDGTKLQLEDVLSQVIDIISHSLGPLSSALSRADWLFQNTKECTPVSAITTLSEAFGIEGLTISISWSWILKQWREFNKGRAMSFLVDEWVTADVGNRRQGKILHATVYYKRYWVTSQNSSECQRLIPIWRSRSRRTDIPSWPCWQIWLQGCDHLFRWHRYFCNVTHVSIQDKCSFNKTIWN